MKVFIRNILPPIIYRLLKAVILRKYGWKGNYCSWEDAQENATGYNSTNIFTQVESSLLKVKSGEAVAERDGVVSNKCIYAWQPLAGLLYGASKSKGTINVLDFGGSLGSVYFQNKKFLDNLSDVQWSIIEQPHFVESGLKNFSDDRLKFYFTIDECLLLNQPNILMLSSVIQYIQNYKELLHKLLSHPFEVIVIDRTPFSLQDKDEIKLQVVPPSIYDASYPSWFISETAITEIFHQYGYRLLEEYITDDGVKDGAVFKGMIWEKAYEFS